MTSLNFVWSDYCVVGVRNPNNQKTKFPTTAAQYLKVLYVNHVQCHQRYVLRRKQTASSL